MEPQQAGRQAGRESGREEGREGRRASLQFKSPRKIGVLILTMDITEDREGGREGREATYS